MIVYRRLLAGLTSLTEALWFSHLSSSGPGGILASSTVSVITLTARPPSCRGLRQRNEEVRVNRQHEEAARQQNREDNAYRVQEGQPAAVVGAQGLERAPEAVGQVQAQKQHYRRVAKGHAGLLELLHHQPVQVPHGLAVDDGFIVGSQGKHIDVQRHEDEQ